MTGAQLWRENLETWAIPQEILDQAPESPWIHPPVLFQIPKLIEMTPSHQIAFEALPEISTKVEKADVAVAHHVVYNVPDIIPFLRAMNLHAKKRVVIEMPQQHPLSNLSSAWKHFWKLERPNKPTPEDLVKVLLEMGIMAHLKSWSAPVRAGQELEELIEFTRIRLCLNKSSEGEIRSFLQANPQPTVRDLATIWWDIPAK